MIPYHDITRRMPYAMTPHDQPWGDIPCNTTIVNNDYETTQSDTMQCIIRRVNRIVVIKFTVWSSPQEKNSELIKVAVKKIRAHQVLKANLILGSGKNRAHKSCGAKKPRTMTPNPRDPRHTAHQLISSSYTAHCILP